MQTTTDLVVVVEAFNSSSDLLIHRFAHVKSFRFHVVCRFVFK